MHGCGLQVHMLEFLGSEIEFRAGSRYMELRKGHL